MSTRVTFWVSSPDGPVGERRRDAAMKFFTENYGGVTFYPARGVDDFGKPEPTHVWDLMLLVNIGAEATARAISDALLDIYDDQERVLFFMSHGLATFMRRPHFNEGPVDVSRVRTPRGGNRDA